MANTAEELSSLLQSIDKKTRDSDLDSQYLESQVSGAEIGAAVLAAINLALELSKKGKETINEIRQKLDKAIELLEKAIKLLEALPVFIREEFRYYVETDLLSAMQAIRINDATWVAQLNSGDENMKRQAIDQIFSIVTNLELKSNNAFRYGYKHCFYMIEACALNVRFRNLLDSPKLETEIDIITSDYLKYFEECKSMDQSTGKETYGTLLKACDAQMNTWENTYVAQTLVYHPVSKDGEATIYWEVTLHITGDIQTGFQFNPVGREIRRKYPRDRYFVEPQNLSIQGTWQDKVNEYQYYKSQYDSLLINANKLKEVIKGINDSIDTIYKVRAEYKLP